MTENDCVFQGTTRQRDDGTSGLRDIAGNARIFFVVPRTRSLVIPRSRGLVFLCSRRLADLLSRCLVVLRSRSLVGTPLSHSQAAHISCATYRNAPPYLYNIYNKRLSVFADSLHAMRLSQLLILHLSLQLCKTCDVAKSGLLNRSVNLLNG